MQLSKCLQGHDWDDENTGKRPDGSRWCRKCNAIRTDRWRRRRNGEQVDLCQPIRKLWSPTIAMQETDWAYLAGLIDGEGCVGVYLRATQHRGKRQRNYRASYKILLNIVNSHRGVLEWVAARIGGDLEPKSKTGEFHKPAWVWRQYRIDAAQETLRRCLPYLKIKREQAELVLQFPAYAAVNQWTPESSEVQILKRLLYDKTKMLNRRGLARAVEAPGRSEAYP